MHTRSAVLRRLVFVALLLMACPAMASSAEEPITLRFGIYQTDTATEMYQRFAPLLDAIEGSMSESLQRPVKLELTIFKEYQEGQDALVDGSVDFVRFGAASYVLSHERNSELELLAMEQKGGKKEFLGVIAVRADSPYKDVADLVGHRFAFGNERSTIGRYLAQAELHAAGIKAGDLAHFEFLGRHDKVAKAVAIGDFDAGAMKINSFNKANADGGLRILAQFPVVTKPWIARSGLSDDLSGALRQSLLHLEDKSALGALKISGFFPTSDAEYEFIRQGMMRSREFAN